MGVALAKVEKSDNAATAAWLRNDFMFEEYTSIPVIYMSQGESIKECE